VASWAASQPDGKSLRYDQKLITFKGGTEMTLLIAYRPN
jgi:hypothetical protein